MQTKSNRILMLIVGLLSLSIMGIGGVGVSGCDLLLPYTNNASYYSNEQGEDYALAMENADRNMINYLSCPNHNPDGIWCKIWRNNNAVLHSIYE